MMLVSKKKLKRRIRIPCAGNMTGDVGLKGMRQTEEAIEAIEGDVGNMVDVGGTADIQGGGSILGDVLDGAGEERLA